jgi:DNA repair exonuclease SbcCD ATPase subunit
MKIIHIADIHWRGLSRHQEYKKSFERFFEMSRELSPDIIYVGGDIVHSKTQGISPELVDSLQEWFKSLASIAPTHIILGNHDGLIMNKDRQDAITPIVSALNNPNLFLYKKSGVYPTGVKGFNWCVFSCFDESGWKNIKPIDGDINIALFHGGVRGSTTDSDWSIEGEVESDFFKDYDYTLLGDIHTCQFLTEDRKIAYCGSTIQQNYGEDPGKGFLFWDIKSKDDFDVTFYEVPHDHPFITIDWCGSVKETLEQVEDVSFGARYRVRSDYSIPQSDIIHLHTELKETMRAHEVVYKIDQSVDLSEISVGDSKIFKEDLRDVNTHVALVREFYKNSDLSDQEWEELEVLIKKYFSRISNTEESLRNVKWSIKNIDFDNMFTYGKDNRIDFNSFKGITGIFGKNRSGKSSIVGTLMYALFNTTDRGPIKNLHIINSRKGHCKTSIDLCVGGKNLRIERQSVKSENRKGEVSASTHLNLYEIDGSGEIVRDLTEEQRRETEKVTRKRIGIAEDFLLTSLSSQGQMNNFIKERATQRKLILSKFLDLNVFDQMESNVKEDLIASKAQMKNIPDRDWGVISYNLTRSIKNTQAKIRRLEQNLEKTRAQASKLQLEIVSHESSGDITQVDVDIQKQSVNNLENKLEQEELAFSNISIQVNTDEKKIIKIRELKDQFSIVEMREKLKSKRDLEKHVIKMKSDYQREHELLKRQEKSLKKLREVPCGDEFPTCKFIKDSHENNKKIHEQRIKVEENLKNLKETEDLLSKIIGDKIEENIEKYEKIIKKESEIQISLVTSQSQKREKESLVDQLSKSLASSRDILKDMEEKKRDVKDISLDKAKLDLAEMNIKISEMDSDRMSHAQKVGKDKSELLKAREEKKSYDKIKKEWRAYNLLSQAVSKKGIPLQIINSYLPVINAEISKILQNNVGFTVELEADLNSNAMDIYINYGDSKRVIELASGMEKMISSLAIRVALTNVSSLPKCDMLIIDEGFGSLDETNVEACNRLLISLKKYFKNILIISHVDAVKDVVDNVIDITKKGKDSRVYAE